MLREGDLFEVVLNPGADKREKRILGQITLSALYLLGPGNTGGASLSTRLGTRRRPDGCDGIAQLLQSIVCLLKSQSRGAFTARLCAKAALIELFEGQCGRDTD